MLFKRKISIQSLKESSSGIISVFTNTINSLTQVNQEIESQIEDKQEAISTLTDEVSTLDELKQSNDKIISKVKQIIE